MNRDHSDREDKLSVLERKFLQEFMDCFKNTKGNIKGRLKDKLNVLLLAHYTHGYLTKEEEIESEKEST